MDFQRALIPYDIHQEYITGNQRSSFHSFEDRGNELVIILNGSAIYRVDERIFPIARGDIFLLTGDFVKEIFDAKQLSICSIFFYDEHIERSTALFRHLVGYQKFFVENPIMQKQRDQDRLRVGELEIQDIEKLISAMMLELRMNDTGSEQILNSMFFILITLIARAYSVETFVNPEPNDAIAQVVSYIRCHYTEDLTLEKLAAVAYLSPRHVDRKFKEIYKMSPSQYIRKLRLTHACSLLEQSNMTIAQVSMLSGFTDLNYFCRIFRNTYHMNPSNYRKQQLSTAPHAKPESLRPNP